MDGGVYLDWIPPGVDGRVVRVCGKVYETLSALAQRILDLTPSVPTLVWGRDTLGAGDMWNSNSVTSWLLARAGVDVSGLAPPVGGRAPGWDAGLVAARRPGNQGRVPGVKAA